MYQMSTKRHHTATAAISYGRPCRVLFVRHGRQGHRFLAKVRQPTAWFPVWQVRGVHRSASWGESCGRSDLRTTSVGRGRRRDVDGLEKRERCRKRGTNVWT